MSALIFSRELKRLMLERGVNQERVAAVAGVTQGAVSGWIKGAAPKTDAAMKLAAFFGVSVDELLRGKLAADLKKHLLIIDGMADRIENSGDVGNAAFNEIGIMQAEFKKKIDDYKKQIAAELREMADRVDPPMTKVPYSQSQRQSQNKKGKK